MGKTRKKDAALQESLRLSAFVHKWTCSYLPSVGAQSPHTVRTYRSSLGIFSGFLSQNKGLTPFNLNTDCFSANVLNEWVVWMKTSAGASSSTCATTGWRPLRVCSYSWEVKIWGRAYLYDAAKKHVKPINEPQREVNSISKEAIKALFQEPDLNSRVGRRDYAFLLLTYGTGMRLDEVLSLRVKDLTMVKGKGAVHVLGKGNKLRTIPLLDNLVDCLCSYMNEFHGRTPKANDLVFYSPCHSMRAKLTQPAISKRLKLYAERAYFKCSEVPLDMHAHVLRHSRATHWREEGLNLVEIMELLGHSSYQSTLIYQTVTDQQKREAIEKMADEEVNNLPKKWLLPENTSLAEAFGIYTK
jgi:site-specific recombinase XerD